MTRNTLLDTRAFWARVESAEAALPSALTLAERLRMVDRLYIAARSQLKATEPLFCPQRQHDLIALQARLRRLGDSASREQNGDVSRSG